EKKMTAEQARALAERLEQNEKKQLEKQIARRQKLEEAKQKADGLLAKKPLFSKKSKKDDTAADASAQETK
ncbi:MAG: hypothetical protein IJL24_01615, partial [Treponema sp.]|nr:hypothetical protein [Treponema sp.]